MLKKIGLAVLFAITLTAGAGAASARNTTKHVPTAPAPQGFCPMMHC
jgi:hypothetical protein